MRSPDTQPQQTIGKYLHDTLANIKIPDREDKKALIRQKCAEISETLGFKEVQGRILAMYYFKLLDSDPEKAAKFWETLYKLHYNATDPNMVVQCLSELSELTSDSGLTYLWNLAYGIIRGDYEVLHGNITDQCYFLYYRQDAEAQHKNPKRIQSLKAAREFVHGSIVPKPSVGLRMQDFVGFSKRESDLFRGILKTLDKHVDVLLCGRVELEDIFEYLEWIKQKLNTIIKELGVSDQIKARYKIFIDSIVCKYLNELFNYASEMNEEVNENKLVRDIMNEPFVVFNNTIDAEYKVVSPIERLKAQWQELKTNLTAFHHNPGDAKATNKTVFFAGQKTPIQGEPIPTKPSNKPAKLNLKKTQYGFPAFAGNGVVKTVAAKVNRLASSSTILGVSAIPAAGIKTLDTEDPQPKIDQLINKIFKSSADLNDRENANKLIEDLRTGPFKLATSKELQRIFISTVLMRLKEKVSLSEVHDKLHNSLRKLFSEMVEADELKLPSDSQLDATMQGMPSLSNFDGMVAHVSSEGLYPQLYNNKESLKSLLLNNVQNLVIYSELEELLRGAPDPSGAIQGKAEQLRKRLDDIKKNRKTFTGGRFKRWFRGIDKNGKKTNEEMRIYFDQIDEFIEKLWEEAISPTLYNFTAIYTDIDEQELIGSTFLKT
jgi:hypothetical protein